MIAGVFLAAGESRRFGTDKLLCDLHGEPLVYHSLKPCLDSTLPRVYVVHHPRNLALQQTIQRLFARNVKLTLVPNPHPERGQMSSLKAGLRALDPGCAGVMVLLADMPRVTVELIDTLLGRFEEEEAVIIPECNGEWCHPRIIPRRLFPEFLRLNDDETGMKAIRKFRGSVTTVPIGDRRDYVDIDTLRDLDSLDPED